MIQYSEDLDTFIANTKECAKLFGVSLSAFQKWRYKPLGKFKNEVYYDICALIQERISEIRDHGISELAQERTKFIKARRERAELELLHLKKTLISIGMVNEVWTDQLENFKAQLTSLPNRMAKLLSTIDNPIEIENIIRKEVQLAFQEIRNHHYGKGKPKGDTT